MKKILTTAMMASALAGRASSSNQQFKDGAEISVQSRLQEGRTTKNEVKPYFGFSDAVSYTNSGNKTWEYVLARVKVNGTTLIPLYGLFHNGTNGAKKELAILFSDNTIEKYTMSEVRISPKSGWVG